MSNVNMELVDKAIDNIDRDRLVKLVMDLVDIPSPTGFEGDVARALNDVLNSSECGMKSVLQPIGDDRYNDRIANSIGKEHIAKSLELDKQYLAKLLEIDRAERGFERADDIGQLFGVGFVEFKIKAVNVRELLEQNRLAFHDRFGRQGADGAQTQDGSAVADHAHQIATYGEIGRFCRVVGDCGTGRRDTR